MLGNFEKCLDETLPFEGGKSNHPKDPGGKTNKGVIQRTYDAFRKARGQAPKDVYLITDAEVQEIYRTGFWNMVEGDRLEAGVDLVTFDAAVNSGPARAKKWLLAAIGGTAVETVKRLCAKRLGFMQSLTIWSTFKNGWSRRVAHMEATGVAWALAAAGTAPAEVKKELVNEQTKAGKDSAKSGAGGAASGGGTAVGANEASQVDAIAGWVLGGIVVAGLLVAAFFIVRAIIHRQRADAYAAAAAK